MADNVTSPIGNGVLFASDDVGGIQYPRTKMSIGADGSATDVSSANPLPIIVGALPAGTNRSGSITTGGIAQQLAALNTARTGLFIQNISGADLWVNEIGSNASINTAGSWKLAPGESFSVSTNRAISIIGATTNQNFTATEV